MWSHVFFIGDLHLNHRNIIRYCDRPFRSIGQMNRRLVSNWNRTVGRDDTVYFLGDLALGRGGHRTIRWLSTLNGNIVFIRGNHDWTDEMESYGKLILNYNGHSFLLTHNPRDVPDRWDDWVIHGHIHNNDLDNFPLVNRIKKTVNVSAELVDYRPISLRELLLRLTP